MNAVENRQDFNLFTLVPQDATAVLETDRVADLMEDINGLHCSKDDFRVVRRHVKICTPKIKKGRQDMGTLSPLFRSFRLGNT